ncbi:MAG TPA: SDR family oxidoreductase [Acidimicrobiia bacterium]|nr:SDR family oxidoreductase [Acidimicrobiia bacterium]
MWADPDNDTARSLMQHYAIRRPGMPDDVAAMTVFLTGEHASWITGQTYPVNGGYTVNQ